MKKSHIILWVICFVVLSGCKENPEDEPKIEVTDVTLNRTELSLAPGDTEQLIAIIEPEDADNKEVRWESDNPEVATVDETGLVTGIKDGRATIRVVTRDGNHTAACLVTVDYRGDWVGSYDCEKVMHIGESTTERVIVDVTANGSFSLLLTEREWEKIKLNIDVNIDSDGKFRAENVRPFVSGYFHSDSVYIRILAVSPQTQWWIDYMGKKIKDE